jgi:chromosome segregation ATPase
LELNVYLEENEIEKKRLLEELEKVEKKNDENETKLGGYLNKLEKDIENFKKENERLNNEIDSYLPEYKQLCQTYDDTVKDYEQHKNELAAVKNRKHDLETTIVSLTRQLEDQDNLKVTKMT